MAESLKLRVGELKNTEKKEEEEEEEEEEEKEEKGQYRRRRKKERCNFNFRLLVCYYVYCRLGQPL